MERIFLAMIVSGILLLATAMSLLVLPNDATATLVRPLPARVLMKPPPESVKARTALARAGDRR